MNRRSLMIAALAAALAAPSAALADDDEVEDLLEDLEELGFSSIATSTSLLGRVQVRASNASWSRELVINPRTGEILRDVWFDLQGRVVPPPQLGDDDDDDDDDHGRGRGRGRGRGGDDDDDD